MTPDTGDYRRRIKEVVDEAVPDPRDGVRVPPDPALVDIIAEALQRFAVTSDNRIPGEVTAAITAPEHREAVLAELRAAWGDDLGGALENEGVQWADSPQCAELRRRGVPPWHDAECSHHTVYRWAEPPRQPAPSTESET